MSLCLCLYVCLFAIIKTRYSNFPELLMMMPMARSTASQVGGDAENARPENDGQTCGHSRFSAQCADAVAVMPNSCPLCRTPIDMVMRVYS